MVILLTSVLETCCEGAPSLFLSYRMSGHVSSDRNVTQAGPIRSGCERNNMISRLLISSKYTIVVDYRMQGQDQTHTHQVTLQGRIVPPTRAHRVRSAIKRKASQDGYRAAQVIRKRRRSPIDAAADRLIQSVQNAPVKLDSEVVDHVAAAKTRDMQVTRNQNGEKERNTTRPARAFTHPQTRTPRPREQRCVACIVLKSSRHQHPCLAPHTRS